MATKPAVSAQVHDRSRIPVVLSTSEPSNSHVAVESNAKVEEVPKKLYSQILKENAATFSSPAPAPRKPVVKNVAQVNQSPAPVANGPDSSGSFDAINNQEPEAADDHSIYIKGLPLTVTPSVLAEVFKKFGAIKNGGIQVRSNRASPIPIGGCQAVVEGKQPPSSRAGSNNRRFLRGWGSGFRNGVRGRGNYVDTVNEYDWNHIAAAPTTPPSPSMEPAFTCPLPGRGSGFRNEGVRGQGDYVDTVNEHDRNHIPVAPPSPSMEPAFTCPLPGRDSGFRNEGVRGQGNYVDTVNEHDRNHIPVAPPSPSMEPAFTYPLPGRGSGFRNEGVRGQGNYVDTVNEHDRNHIPGAPPSPSMEPAFTCPLPGRGSGFRNEGVRGQGNYVDTVNEHDRNHIPVAPPSPSMEPAFGCPICMGPLVEAMSTRCGHIFCKVCINASIAGQSKCPTCRKKTGMKDIIRVYLPTTY